LRYCSKEDNNSAMSISFKAIAVITIAFVSFVSVSILPVTTAHASTQERQNIRVGVYDNYPKIYRDDAGQIKGFWVDITNEIAKKENWNVTYVFGTFDQGLERLRAGHLDMMVDVGVSPERQQQFDFNNEYVLSGWAAVYARNGVHVNSYLDLTDKKIAVVKSDIHNTGPDGIRATLASFGVNATFIEVDSYEDVFKALDTSRADAGVVSGLYGAINDNKYRSTRTGVIFNPIQIKYALTKNADKNPYFISTIDSNLLAMKNDPGSVYYQSIDENLGRFTREVNKIPTWFYLATIIAFSLLALAALVVFAMRQYQKKLQNEIKNRIGQIKDNEEKYSAGVNQAQDGIAIIQNEKIIFANRAINIIGYPEKEVIGKRITDLLAPEEKKKVESLHHNRISGNATAPIYETTLLRRDGTKVDVEISSGVINYSGEPAVLVLVRDITQRKKMQEDIKLQNTILAAELEVSINGVLIVDKIGNIILYNDRFVDIWQVPKDALESRSDRIVLNSVIHLAKDPQEFLEKINYLNKHKSKTDQSEVQMVDGRILERYTSPLYVDKKVYVGRVWFFQDITERKMHAEKMAQVERAKHEFVSIAAHQLRAPVTSIMNASHVLNDYETENLTDTQNHCISMIIKGTDQMNELVDFLLMMTKAETGTMMLSPAPIRLKSLTKDLMTELESAQKRKSMKFKLIQKPSKIPPVFVDKSALTQVIINLLSNAIDYSPEGSEILVTIVSDKYAAEFSVADKGIGIPSEDQDKIFDKFYRSDKAKVFSQNGTGLGLPLAKSIVESWGGKIWVESEENKGSIFHFTIPISEDLTAGSDIG
jgi:PAS domain S-box-containing protein